MIARTFTYVDYDGIERTETHHFHLEQAEILKMEMGVSGGMRKLLQKIIDEKDSKRLYEHFENLVQKSYGVKSNDGRRFDKDPKLLDEFMQTPVYSMLIMELAFDTDKAIEFTNGILPKALTEKKA